MRNLSLLLCLAASPTLADSQLKVESHTLLRLPVSGALLQLERLEVAEQGTLLVPASITELRIGELHLGRSARIGVAPSEQPLRLEVREAHVGEGAWISAQGAPGSMLKPRPRRPRPGRSID